MGRMTPERLAALIRYADVEWRTKISAWQKQTGIRLFREIQEILCRAVSSWEGLPLDDREAADRTREFAAMIDGAGSGGPRNWLVYSCVGARKSGREASSSGCAAASSAA